MYRTQTPMIDRMAPTSFAVLMLVGLVILDRCLDCVNVAVPSLRIYKSSIANHSGDYATDCY